MDARRIAAAAILDWAALALYRVAVVIDRAADIFDRHVPVITEEAK